MIVRNSKLWFCRGTSDKSYELVMSEQQEGSFTRFTVIARWGRRNKTQSEQVKVSSLSRYSADLVYDQIMEEKIEKGYTRMTAS
jgi:hypothetical protein